MTIFSRRSLNLPFKVEETSCLWTSSLISITKSSWFHLLILSSGLKLGSWWTSKSGATGGGVGILALVVVLESVWLLLWGVILTVVLILEATGAGDSVLDETWGDGVRLEADSETRARGDSAALVRGAGPRWLLNTLSKERLKPEPESKEETERLCSRPCTSTVTWTKEIIIRFSSQWNNYSKYMYSRLSAMGCTFPLRIFFCLILSEMPEHQGIMSGKLVSDKLSDAAGWILSHVWEWAAVGTVYQDWPHKCLWFTCINKISKISQFSMKMHMVYS